MMYLCGHIFLLLLITSSNLHITKKMFGYMRRDSMTGVLLELSLPTFDTVIHNSRIIFANQVTMSSNNIVQWFLSIGVL